MAVNKKEHRYRNPFFNRRPRGKRTKLAALAQSKLAATALILLLAGGAWFFLYSGYFEVKHIQVSGQGRLNETKLQNTVWHTLEGDMLVIIPEKNLFWLDIPAIKNALKEKFAFDKLKVQKDWPQTLRIKYQEKNYAFIWQENKDYYYIDDKGFFVTKTNPENIKQKDYPLIRNTATSTAGHKDKVTVTPAVLDFISRTKQALAKYEDLVLDRFQLTTDTNSVTAKLKRGPDIYFNTQANLSAQMDKLMIVKKEKLEQDFYKKNYIDVRIGDNVYYR